MSTDRQSRHALSCVRGKGAMMKRSKQSVPSRETGATAGDFNRSQSIAWQNKGGRNATTDESRRGAGGIAPKPSGGAAMPGNDRPAHPSNGGLARVQDTPSSGSGFAPTAGSFNPVQNNAMANLTGQSTGQAEVLPRGNSARIAPKTKTPVTNHPLATAKPKRRGTPAPFYGDWS